MSRLTAEADNKASEYADIWENMDEEAKATVCKDDDESAFDTKKFKSAIKNGDLDKESVECINAIQDAIAKEKALRKQVKTIETGLEDKAKEKIEVLSEEEIHELLEEKWVSPIISAIDKVGERVLTQFVASFVELEKKYANPLAELSESIEETSGALRTSLDELVGNDADMTAIKMLMEEL